MPLAVGSRIAHYDVTALIGEGGMGQVYQATDTKLNRQVALKILPEAFAADPDRLARFQREAQVLASLNHPNIAQIHGIEEQDDTRALVLELVEGPTLAERIKQGPIPLDEALPIAKQIAEALEAAHEAGVIHRDLKPANIKVREDGTVKVLDFGLAKALDPSPTSDPSQSPTLTAAATQMGVIMGTAAYMSPEQAAGQPTDKRGDIWSFGVVLFEMLTAQRLFTGKTVSHVLAKVLDRDVDFEALPTTTPEPCRRLLSRCLEREPKRRLRDVGEAVIHLEEAAAAPAVGPSAGAATVALRVWQRPMPLVIIALVLVAMTGLTVWSLMRAAARPTLQPTNRFAITLPASGEFAFGLGNGLALSPDGRSLVYVGLAEGTELNPQQLYQRTMDQLDVRPLRDTQGANRPFFSPDGEWVGFAAAAGLRRVSLAGGSALTISALDSGFRGGSWGPDDTVVFATANSGLLRVSASGGIPEPVTRPEDDGESYSSPHVLPGGRAVLFYIRSATLEVDQIAVYSFDTREQRVLLPGKLPRFAAGHLVFGRGASLWAAPFDVIRLELTGEPFLVLEDVAVIGGSALLQFDIADDGSLVYLPGGAAEAERTLVWVDREGREEPLTAEPRVYESVRISPDGTRVALSALDQETDIWIWDFSRETLTRLSFDPAGDFYPVWTPDGQRVVFESHRSGEGNLFAKSADGTGEVERLTESPTHQSPLSMSPNGEWIVFQDGTAPRSLALLPSNGERSWESLLDSGFDEQNGEISPDGRWIAYQSTASGRAEIYVQPFPNVDEGRWQISTGGGTQPLWAPDGRELFYLAPGGDVMAVLVQTEPTFTAGNGQVVFEGSYLVSAPGGGRTYDVAPDGQHFLMITARGGPDGPSAPTSIIVVQNWHQELTERVPVP